MRGTKPRARLNLRSIAVTVLLYAVCAALVVFHYGAAPAAAPAPAMPTVAAKPPEPPAVAAKPPPPPLAAKPPEPSAVAAQPPPPPVAAKPPPLAAKPAAADDDRAVHVVFSTDCSGYQHWQGIALWYASRAAGHVGPITRIASGCDEAQQKAVSREWRAVDATGDFRAHFAPTGALKGGYKYSNKPSGLYHWLTHATFSETYVILIDPDMLMLKPLTVDVAAGLTRGPRNAKKQYEFVDGNGVAQLLSVFDRPADRVRKGRPAGQHFGIGGVWARAGTPAARPSWVSFSKAKVCGERGPCVTTSAKDADDKYGVGPVYAAHVDDWRVIASRWVAAMPRVHAQYPQLLAEMYALTMAAANTTIPWSLVSSYMVSDPKTQSPTEAWTWVDDLAKGDPGAVCRGATATEFPAATRDRRAVALPKTLHYCQRYELAGVFWAKRKTPHDLFRCDRAHLDFDVGALMAALEATAPPPSRVDARTAFMLCHVIPLANSFIDAYKRDACPPPIT